MALQFRRGTEAEKTASTFVPAEGEPIYLTDTNRIFIGDGSTVGGIEFTGVSTFANLPDVTTSAEINLALAYYSVTSNVVSITLSSSHDYQVGDSVVISSSSVSALNGTHTITNVPGAAGFDFALTTADVANTAVTGDVYRAIRDGEVLTYDSTGGYWTNLAPVTSLNLLEDVNLEGLTLANNQGLLYSTSLSAWTAQTLSTAQLDDINITSVAGGQVLQYDAATAKWLNVTLPHVDTLLGLTDVSATSPTDNQFLRYNDTDSEWQSVTLNLNGISNVNAGSPADGDSLVWNSTSSEWINQAGTAFYTFDDRFYVNSINDQEVTRIERLGLVYNNYSNQAEQVSLVPDFDPTVSWFDRYEGTVQTPSEFGNWTRTTAGTGDRANGEYFIDAGNSEAGDIWTRDTSSASPLDNIGDEKIWFEIDVKWQPNATRGFSDVEIFSLVGRIDGGTTNRAFLTLFDNYSQQSDEEGRFYLEGYEWTGDLDSVTTRDGDTWYRICGSVQFNGQANTVALWVGERDVDTELTRVIYGDAEDFDFGNYNPTTLDVRSIRILRNAYEDYWIDNFYIGFGENRYSWQPAESTISMERTFGSTPKQGAIAESNISKIKTTTHTTASIADASSEDWAAAIGQSGFLRKVTVDRACRVRAYVTDAARTSDAARTFATAPGNYIGLIFDHEFAAAGNINMTPCPIYSVADSSTEETLDVYFTVENQSGSASTVQVDIEYTELEYNLFE